MTPPLLERILGVLCELEVQLRMVRMQGITRTLLELPSRLWCAWREPEQSILYREYCAVRDWLRDIEE